MHSISPEASSLPEKRPLTRRDYRTIGLSTLGSALEFYDFVIFVFFAQAIGQLFFPASIPVWLRQLQTYGIFAAGYFARPLGGIMMAHFGDLFGRKRIFTLSVLMMSLPTLAIGILPTYATIGILAPILLLLMRVLQGAAVGGEVPSAWVFVAEHAPLHRTGLVCGIMTGGLSLGIFLGAMMSTLINTAYTPDQIIHFAWRLPFLIGGLFGVLAMFLRRWLDETPVFIALKKDKQLAGEMPLKAIMRDHRSAVVTSMLLTWMLSAAIIVVILMTPTLLQARYSLLATDVALANSLATLCLALGCVIAGVLCDRFGARRVIQLGCLALALCYALLWIVLDANLSALKPMYALTGLIVGVVGAIPSVMVRAFPAVVRFSGVSFSYNVAYAVFGGLTPIIVALFLNTTAIAPVLYVAALCIVGAIVMAYTKHQPLVGATRSSA
jgi:MFS family permease